MKPTDRLVSHLREARLNSAATLVRLDLRAEAHAVLRDIAETRGLSGWTPGTLHDWRKATTAIVRRWEKGHDEFVTLAFDAWEVRGCEDCARVAAERAGRACDDHLIEDALASFARGASVEVAQ